jgi:hypothetical protein
MPTVKERKWEIVALAAQQAIALPKELSGFWFHGDIRDNFFYAAHLYEAVDHFGKELAVDMLIKVLHLQDRDPQSDTYGHWPLQLAADPATSKPNPLPVELMGCFIAFLYERHQASLPKVLHDEMLESLRVIYESKLYMQGVQAINHHESKLTSLKILIGERFQDERLIEEGLEQARTLLNHIQANGMREYGSLPWLWHWIQAFTCVWETTSHSKVKRTVSEMLQYLWKERAAFYLKGAWVGPHSRELPHDIPRDCNCLLDYVQLGDFAQPTAIFRLEGAGLFSYEIDDEVRSIACHRKQPIEIRKKIPKPLVGNESSALHSYTYITEHYALGGMWEHSEEYLNEQHRWDISWPLDAVQEGNANQLFFYHPGQGHMAGDDRHSSSYAEIMLYKNALSAAYMAPLSNYNGLIGCLPPGKWLYEERAVYGIVGKAYVYIHLMHPYEIKEKADRITILSPFEQVHSVSVQVYSLAEAEKWSINSLEGFRQAVAARQHSIAYHANEQHQTLRTELITLNNDQLLLEVSPYSGDKTVGRQLNGKPIVWSDYAI